MSFFLRRKKHVFLLVCGYTALCLDMRGVCVPEFSNDAFKGWPIFVKGELWKGRNSWLVFLFGGRGNLNDPEINPKESKTGFFLWDLFFPPRVLIFWDFIFVHLVFWIHEFLKLARSSWKRSDKMVQSGEHQLWYRWPQPGELLHQDFWTMALIQGPNLEPWDIYDMSVIWRIPPIDFRPCKIPRDIPGAPNGCELPHARPMRNWRTQLGVWMGEKRMMIQRKWDSENACGKKGGGW